MSPKTEHSTCVQEEAPPLALEVNEPSANNQLIPVRQASHQLSTINHQLSSHLQPTGRVRVGKIARLPKQYREMVSRMLRNNCSARNIIDALGELGITVTQRNISNWKTRGGYQEWCLEEDRAAEIRLQQDNLLQYLRKEQASQIPEVGLQLASSHISRYLLQPEAIQQLVAEPEKYARVVAILCRVSDQIHKLQKYRDDSAKSLGWKHNPELVRRESEQQIENVRESYTSTPAVKSNDDAIPHRNFMPIEGLSERPVDLARTSEPDSRKRELEALKNATDLTSLFSKKMNPGSPGSKT